MNYVSVDDVFKGVQIGHIVINPETKQGWFLDKDNAVVFIRPAEKGEEEIAREIIKRCGL